MKKNRKNSGFTLVELLVVIAIIGILVTIVAPQIGTQLQKAQQLADVTSARNVGVLMFNYAVDNDNQFPGGETSTDAFNAMFQEGYLQDPSILLSQKYAGKQKFTSGDELSAKNVGYAIATLPEGEGIYATDPDGLPLIFSDDSALTLEDLDGDAVPLPELEGDGAHKKAGIAVCYKSNKAEFIAAKKSKDVYWIPAGVEGDYVVARP